VNIEAYGRLEILPRARAVLDGGELFMCKDPTVKRAATKRPSAASKAPKELNMGCWAE